MRRHGEEKNGRDGKNEKERGRGGERQRQSSRHVTRGPPPPYCSCAVWGSTCATRPRSACCLPPGSQEQLQSQSLAVSSPRRRQLCRGSGAQESLCTLRNMSGRARVRARGMAPRHGAREVGSTPGNLMVSVSPCPSCGHPGLLLFLDFSLLPRVSTSPPPPKWLDTV